MGNVRTGEQAGGDGQVIGKSGEEGISAGQESEYGRESQGRYRMNIQSWLSPFLMKFSLFLYVDLFVTL